MTVQQPTGTQGFRKDDSATPSDDKLLDEVASPLWRDIVATCQRVVVWFVSLGAVPRHMVIVPDGHRRFSRTTNTDLRRSYAIGAHKYFMLRDWCFRAGVDMLSVFVVSVRNFSRNTFDITSALNRANKIHAEVVENVDEYRCMGLQSCACGDLERMPEELRATMARAEIATSNLGEKSLKTQMSCAAYNTTHQMSRMALHLAKAVKEGNIQSDDVTGEFLDDYVAITECPSAELVFRTAGDQRFSDFEVLQCNYAYFHLVDKRWPEVGFLGWLWAMVSFQLHWPTIQAVKEKHVKTACRGSCRSDPEQVIRQQKFLRHVYATKILNTERLADLGKDVACQ